MIGGIARAFALVAITVPAAWSLDLHALVGLLALAIVWMAAMTVAGLFKFPRWIALMIESGLVGCIVGASVPHTLLLTPALAVTPFVSGALRGPKGVAECLAVQLGAVSITAAQLGWQSRCGHGRRGVHLARVGSGFRPVGRVRPRRTGRHRGQPDALPRCTLLDQQAARPFRPAERGPRRGLDQPERDRAGPRGAALRGRRRLRTPRRGADAVAGLGVACGTGHRVP